ncbi:PIN domain-containing protein [Candidatus Collierbacteria bacterium]|nr:PIN domain-containing protein [Candidatus Collierbacteria bacterium]
MRNIVIDTSLIINHLRKTTDDLNILGALHANCKANVIVPYEVVVEIFVGTSTKEKVARKLIDETLEKFTLVGLTKKSAMMAGELIRKFPQIPGPFDLIIAAISLEHKAQVATHNPKHFKLIKGLKIWKAQIMDIRP